MSLSFEGKVALVTGANRGIGRAIAHDLAANGAIVAGTSRSERGADEISGMLRDINGVGIGIELDITQYDLIRGRLTQIEEYAGKAISIVVNNAGVSKNGLAAGVKETFDEVIDTNLKGTFRITQAVGLKMKQAVKKGAIEDPAILTLGSIVGVVGEPGQVAYGMSKAALNNMTNTLEREWPEVRMSILHPGLVETDMTSAEELGEDRIAKILDMTNSGIAIQPKEIAMVALDILRYKRRGVFALDDGIVANMGGEPKTQYLYRDTEIVKKLL